MMDTIGNKLTSLCEPILPFFLSEAETETYPYAVYDQTVTPLMTKDGTYAYAADARVRVYSDDFDEAQQRADDIITAISTDADARYRLRVRGQSKTCQEDVWCIELDVYIKQIVI